MGVVPGALFGNDGHLLMDEVRATVPILNYLQQRTRSQLALDAITEAAGVETGQDTAWTSRLHMLRDKHGNTYDLCEVYIRLYSFDIGIVRFAVCAHGAITQQALLDVQNSVMRLGDPKQAGWVASSYPSIQPSIDDTCVRLLIIMTHSHTQADVDCVV